MRPMYSLQVHVLNEGKKGVSIFGALAVWLGTVVDYESIYLI